MGIAQNLPQDGIFLTAEQWSEIQETLLNIKQAVCKESYLVDTSEAALLLNKTQRTIQEWHRKGKMPKLASKANENLSWKRSDVMKMCEPKPKIGRPKRNHLK